MGSYNLDYGAYAHDLTQEQLSKLKSVVRKNAVLYCNLTYLHEDFVDDIVGNILFDAFNQHNRFTMKKEAKVSLANQVFQTATRPRYYIRFDQQKKKNHAEMDQGWQDTPLEDRLYQTSRTNGNFSSDFNQSVETELFLDCLGPIQKKAFKMHLHKFTSEEIAEEIGKSSRQVRRILDNVREVLSQEWALAA